MPAISSQLTASKQSLNDIIWIYVISFDIAKKKLHFQQAFRVFSSVFGMFEWHSMCMLIMHKAQQLADKISSIYIYMCVCLYEQFVCHHKQKKTMFGCQSKPLPLATLAANQELLQLMLFNIDCKLAANHRYDPYTFIFYIVHWL